MTDEERQEVRAEFKNTIADYEKDGFQVEITDDEAIVKETTTSIFWNFVGKFENWSVTIYKSVTNPKCVYIVLIALALYETFHVMEISPEQGNQNFIETKNTEQWNYNRNQPDRTINNIFVKYPDDKHKHHEGEPKVTTVINVSGSLLYNDFKNKLT